MSVKMFVICLVIHSQDTRYYEIFYSHYYTQSLKVCIFQKNNYQITEIEQQILQAINHIEYVAISGIQRFLKKKSKKKSS